MIKAVKARNVEIGVGAPKIIVSISAPDGDGILEKAESLRHISGEAIDLVEWRADFYEEIGDVQKTLSTLAQLRTALGDTPLIFAFRTEREGGGKAISPADYTALNRAVAASGNADFVDVEAFSSDGAAEEIRAIRAAGTMVIGSYHDFSSTPPKEEIVRRLRSIQEMDADIPKVAFMPGSTADVLALLAASSEMHERYADRPIIAISMSPKGVVSRLAGEAFGSAMTFGAVGQASAPGQIPVERLVQALEIFHDSL